SPRFPSCGTSSTIPGATCARPPPKPWATLPIRRPGRRCRTRSSLPTPRCGAPRPRRWGGIHDARPAAPRPLVRGGGRCDRRRARAPHLRGGPRGGRAGADSARVATLLAALARTDPVICDLIGDQLGNFWIG